MSEALLPSSATAQERELDLSTARVGDVPSPLRDVWNADSCPESLLPWLAWAFSLDNWDATWTAAQQRAAIKQSVALHRYKGTIGAVKDALQALGFQVDVQEWFNLTPAGDPYTFRLVVNVDQQGADMAALNRLQEIVNTTKNLRSHLDTITPNIRTPAGPLVAAVVGMGNEIEVAYGWSDFPYLLQEGAVNGDVPTEAAVDALHTLLHTTLPGANYW